MKRSALIFVVLSTLASAINYAAYPLLSRILVDNEYIHITVSLSVLTQITTFLSSIVAITIGLSKDEDSKEKPKDIQLLQASLFKLFLVVTAIFLILSPSIMSSIQTPFLFAIPIAIMMIVSVPLAIMSGYLNGRGLMTKLGLLTVISAGLQLTIGASIAYVTKSGLFSLIGMALAQVIAIALIRLIFAKDNLPKLKGSLGKSTDTTNQPHIRRLLVYGLFASIAIMAMNIAQITDLLIIQTLRNTDVRLYTDIYILSRIVFFAGIIFIWPFLGELDIHVHALNRKPFFKLIGIFSAIVIATILIIIFSGTNITHLLFGGDYTKVDLRTLGILSVLYKFFFLIITAATLYFIVFRNYLAVWLSLGICGLIFLFSLLVDKNTSNQSVLVTLNIIAGLGALAGILFVLFNKPGLKH